MASVSEIWDALDFTISSDCFNGGRVNTNNHTGGTGVYDRSFALHSNETDALNDTQWVQLSSGSSGTSTLSGGDGTFWVALRDRNNQSNKIAKSIRFFSPSEKLLYVQV